MKNKNYQTAIVFLIIFAWLVISGYLCIGGLSMIEAIEKVKLVERKIEKDLIRTITYNNSEHAELPESYLTMVDIEYYANKQKHLTYEDKAAMNELCHVYWYYGFEGYSFIIFLTIMPYIGLLFLTVGSAGLLGNLARLFLDHVRNVLPIVESKYIASPISGFFMGLMILAISYVIPSIFIQGNNPLNTTSVVLISFFAGIFIDSFYNRIMAGIESFLKPSSATKDAPKKEPSN